MEEWAGAEGQDQGLAGAPPPVVLHALLLGQRHLPQEGDESVVEQFIDLPLPVRQACRYGLPAPDGAGLECKCRDDHRLAGQVKLVEPPVKSTWSRSPGATSRKGCAGRRQLSRRADQGPEKPQRPTRPAAQARHPPHPPRRTPRRCPHGGQGRRADRKSQLARSAAGAGGRRDRCWKPTARKTEKIPSSTRSISRAAFLSIARETKCLNEADCDRLNEMREVLDEERPEGFTDEERRSYQASSRPRCLGPGR